MEVKEIVDMFNDAMRDIRYGFWTFGEGDDKRKILAEGIMKMEKIMDPLYQLIKPALLKEEEAKKTEIDIS